MLVLLALCALGAGGGHDHGHNHGAGGGHHDHHHHHHTHGHDHGHGHQCTHDHGTHATATAAATDAAAAAAAAAAKLRAHPEATMSTFLQECDVPGWSTPAGEPPWAALRSFARGLSAGREGDHALARRSFADVLRDFPHCPAVHYNVGVAYHRLAALRTAHADDGEEDEAHKDGSRFLEAAADSYRAAINLGDGAHFTASALDEPALGNLRVLRAGSSSSPPLPPLPPLQSEPSSSTATAAATTSVSSVTTAATDRNTRDPRNTRNTLTTAAGAAIYDRTTVDWSEDMRCQHVTYVRASSWDPFPSFSSSASGRGVGGGGGAEDTDDGGGSGGDGDSRGGESEIHLPDLLTSRSESPSSHTHSAPNKPSHPAVSSPSGRWRFEHRTFPAHHQCPVWCRRGRGNGGRGGGSGGSGGSGGGGDGETGEEGEEGEWEDGLDEEGWGGDRPALYDERDQFGGGGGGNAGGTDDPYYNGVVLFDGPIEVPTLLELSPLSPADTYTAGRESGGGSGGDGDGGRAGGTTMHSGEEGAAATAADTKGEGRQTTLWMSHVPNEVRREESLYCCAR